MRSDDATSRLFIVTLQDVGTVALLDRSAH